MLSKKLTMTFCVAGIVASAVVGQAVTIDTVWVGNSGNASDTTGYGAVGYAYKMGKYEVTNSQYCEFLNNKAATDTYGLYNTYMSSDACGGINRSGSSDSYTYAVKLGYENMPVTYVSWYDSVRFANWLQNGQGSGSTESGTYTISGGGVNSGSVDIPDAATRTSWGSANRHWTLPSENEWYKVAYHQPAAQDGDTDNYWLYPTATNSEPYSDNPASLNYPANSANYYNSDGQANGYNDGFSVTGSTSRASKQNYLTNVGAYTLSDSFYGTFDQGGNVWEWNEADIWEDGSSRGIRGGDWDSNSYCMSAVYSYGYFFPSEECCYIGFRVALVPEPCSLILFGIGAVSLLGYAWRQRNQTV